MCANRLAKFGLLAGLLVASGLVMASDVKMYDKAPSVEELQRQLTGGDATAGRAKPRTRAIVFGDAAPAAPEAEQAPQQYTRRHHLDGGMCGDLPVAADGVTDLVAEPGSPQLGDA